jgi:hypothetical protein
MSQRLVWFFLGAGVSSVFWLAVINGIGRTWLDQLLTP